MFRVLNRVVLRLLARMNDTDRATRVNRRLFVSLPRVNVYVDTYRTPKGRTFTRTVREYHQ